ncbi:hypothetical protein WA026_016023 [Henosepilachna vigintioctopunctata]|uniref:Uncharacterized protein n=1 Tax=Henosepilachna vigintioctopunctata TaxID=420089 RepID=A0AAW1UAD4_9CUCU
MENIKIEDNEVEWCKEATYLGITKDKELTWKKHIENVIKKTKAAMAQLYPILHPKRRQLEHLVYSKRADSQRTAMGSYTGTHEEASEENVRSYRRERNEELRELTSYDPEGRTNVIQRRHRRPKSQYKKDD